MLVRRLLVRMEHGVVWVLWRRHEVLWNVWLHAVVEGRWRPMEWLALWGWEAKRRWRAHIVHLRRPRMVLSVWALRLDRRGHELIKRRPR